MALKVKRQDWDGGRHTMLQSMCRYHGGVLSCQDRIRYTHTYTDSQYAAVAPRPSTMHPLVWAEPHQYLTYLCQACIYLSDTIAYHSAPQYTQIMYFYSLPVMYGDVLFMEVSSFEECPYLPCFSGYISCLRRCPQFRGVLIEGFHLPVMYYNYRVSCLWRCPHLKSVLIYLVSQGIYPV